MIDSHRNLDGATGSHKEARSRRGYKDEVNSLQIGWMKDEVEESL